MVYDLTEKQKDVARAIVKAIREEALPETFSLNPKTGELVTTTGRRSEKWPKTGQATLKCLELGNLVVLGQGWTAVTAKIFRAVDTDFAEERPSSMIPVAGILHPPEIAVSLDRFRARHPEPNKVGFLIMRFAATKPFARIATIVKRTAAELGLAVLRADENDFHADLWGNVRTYLHGCGFGIAVYERIEAEEPNANIGLEVGYLMAMNKPVLLLKAKTVKTLQADLAGKLYKPFDPHDPENTIPDQLTKWLEDNGVIVPGSLQRGTGS